MSKAHPFLCDGFHVDWLSLRPENVEPDIREALGRAEQNLAAIRAVTPEGTTFENTFAALENATDDLDRAWSRLNHLDSVADTPEQREVLNKMLPEVSAFYSQISLDSALWSILCAYADGPEAPQLNSTQKRLMEETLASFEEEGAKLQEVGKRRLAEINSELSQLTQKYGENVLDSTNAWEYLVSDSEQLAGIAQDVQESFREDALSKGHGSADEPVWRLTLQGPCVTSVLQYAGHPGLRQVIWEANCDVAKQGEHDNTHLIEKILNLRHEKASLLGHKSFADLTLQRRMAKSGDNALEFTHGLHAKIFSAFQGEMEELKHFRSKETGKEAESFAPWDAGYWMEKHRKALYDFDEEELRPYFPLAQVMEGMFSLLGRLFGFRVTERKNVPVWHPDVTFHDLHDAESGKHLGSFYTDWHPRENKRGGAWMNFLEARHTMRDEPHIGLICGNLTKPTSAKPALLTHREVETVFHEFGHLLHLLLSEVPHKSLSGTKVAWDFVELPSQIMENFCWQRESLDQFARHYQTGEAIPETLFAKMTAARNHMSASAFMRQLAFGKLDLELHHNHEKYAGRDIEEIDREILADYRAELSVEPPSIARRFGHLFSSPTGYAAGYYSYKWAEVLDADAFTRFLQEGTLNPDTGRAFREEILAKGNAASPEELYRNFMQRDPDTRPLLVRSGLADGEGSYTTYTKPK